MNIKLKCSNKISIINSYKFNTGEPAVIHFETDYDMTSGKIKIKNGGKEKTFEFTKDFQIPDEFLFAGRLCITVEMKMAGKTVKHWDFAPIQIIETEEGCELCDEITTLTKMVEDLDCRVKKLEKKHAFYK